MVRKVKKVENETAENAETEIVTENTDTNERAIESCD